MKIVVFLGLVLFLSPLTTAHETGHTTDVDGLTTAQVAEAEAFYTTFVQATVTAFLDTLESRGDGPRYTAWVSQVSDQLYAVFPAAREPGEDS